ncbi:unnamed protein product [Caenorhabditis auriculariae]|uniref:Domain of unknown function DB domain-containing protein n=1 Tax=Caenorhabditis auriculariae TaxID=2777116 RepID=A0A8S1HF03_9PELO|nr:unnamed protein product [Caenorhabditis auriculariae]
MRFRLLLAFLYVFLLCILPVELRRDANQKLKACCARQKAADKQCKRRFCDFDAINQNNMLHYLNVCSPKNDTVQLINVLPACLPYCAAEGSVPTDHVQHVFCMQNFDLIRQCFKSHLDQHPNIFGDN